MKVYVTSVVYRYPEEDGPGFIAGVYLSETKANETKAGISKNSPIIVPFEKSSNPITSLYKNTGNVINLPPTAKGTP